MAKQFHEIRDPIHVFIRVDSKERKVLNSRPFQRLRHIHQLALTNLVYPGATHRRFEHSLGVMELAGRVYDVVMDPANMDHESARSVVPDAAVMEYDYWRRVLRMAALCHDIGHLPFSHAAERELLPAGWDHERLTVELIRSADLAPIWKEIKVQPDDVAKLAVGPKKYRDGPFTDLEAILSEIITGDAFGVDRMDYLLRDSYHTGVAYGRFDHYRLIDTLRILPRVTGPPAAATDQAPEEEREKAEADRGGEPTLGIAEGGLQSAEALLLARYFMYSQLYFHPVRRVYDLHLKDFLREWLPDGIFPTDLEQHLRTTDNEVMVALLAAARDSSARGHEAARRIVHRGHHRVLYQRNPDDIAVNPEAAKAVFDAARMRYNDTNVHYDTYREEKREIDFPVQTRDGRIVSSLALSETLKHIPVVAVDFVFIAPELRDQATKWLKENFSAIIAPKSEEQP